MKPVIVAPLAPERSSLSIVLDHEDAAQLRHLAIRHQTSPAALARLAVRQLLAQTRTGALPLIVPASLANAVAVDFIKLTSRNAED